MPRTALALIGLVLALAATALAGPRAPAPAPAAVTATTFFASGNGWGHGVGMSQYGALGYANDGWTYDQILAHYYTGPTLGPAPVARVRVLVGEEQRRAVVSSAAPYRVRDVFGKIHPLAAGAVELGPKLSLTLSGTPTELAAPVTFLPGAAPLTLDGRAYRGQLEVAAATGKLNVVNAVGLEQYLHGVVAQEMPSGWPAEALKAQAVAARSYALARRVTGRGFDLYADVRSQVYGGIAGERPTTTAAVDATKGEVLLWEGKAIDALFHSTSGGATIDAAEVFGKPVPYLVGVDDPWSSLSPVHRWGPTPVADASLRKALKLRTPVTALKLTRAASGRVARVDVTAGTVSTRISGADLRSAGGLRSTWITRLATLSVTRPGGPAVYGKPVAITGKALGVTGAVLEQRVAGVWKRLAAPGNAPSAKVRFTAPGLVRITAGKLAGPTLKIPLAPLVTARASSPLTVAGSVRPVVPGTAVELQVEQAPDVWLTVADAATGADGTFTAVLPEPGTYRIRVAPAGGLVQGLSARVVLR
jgi:stage II sporulation protein D